MAKTLLAIGAGASVAASLGAIVYYYRNVARGIKAANQLPPLPGTTDPDTTDPSVFDGSWRFIPDKPINEYGDNWGITPTEWIPYFQALEDISGIPGSARIFSLIAYGESRWIADAHNNDASEISLGSRPSYERAKDNFPPLKYGEEAANFGSGGLFAMLGPVYLWTGAVFGKRYAPLLEHRPETMFDPRLAGFAAIVFLRNLIKNRDVRDLVDIKVGWGRPTRLSKTGRETEAYENARTKFWAQSVEAGISLEDRNTLPPKLDISGFTGVLNVYERMIAL